MMRVRRECERVREGKENRLFVMINGLGAGQRETEKKGKKRNDSSYLYFGVRDRNGLERAREDRKKKEYKKMFPNSGVFYISLDPVRERAKM